MDEANKLISNGTLSKAAWLKINAVMLVKRRQKIWSPEDPKDLEKITEGFRTLYNDIGDKKLGAQSKIPELLKEIVAVAAKASELLINLPPVQTPYSSALDLNGFSQRTLLQAIRGRNAYEDLVNYANIAQAAKESDDPDLFFHNISRVILFKKIDEVSTWKDLRPISILPAAIIILEKLTLPILKNAIKSGISITQYAARDGSDCNLAKLRMYFLNKKKGLTKALLIDIRKAFDSVKLELLQEKLRNLLHEDEAANTLIGLMIEVYKLIVLNINGNLVYPQNGLPQGSVWALFLFCYYIDDTLEQTKHSAPRIEIQAFVDDIIIQADSISNLQQAFNSLSNGLTLRNMIINPDKCELISEDETHFIQTTIPECPILAKTLVKYLGQTFDIEGNPTTVITQKMLGKIICILSSASSLTRRARTLIFQTYIRSKVAHLLPQISLAGTLPQTWKCLRNIIFRYILSAATLPRESAALFGLSYYDIIIKPLLRLIERDALVTADEEQTSFLIEACKPALLYWTTAEPNLKLEIKLKIADTIENKLWHSATQWDDIIRTQAVLRLFRNSSIPQNYHKLTGLKQPTLILYLSNAPRHIIHQRITQYHTTQNQTIKDTEYLAALNLLYTYVMITSATDQLIALDIAPPEDTDPATQIDYYTIREIRIQEILLSYHNLSDEKANQILANALTINTHLSENSANYIEHPDIETLLTNLQHSATQTDKSAWDRIETALLILEEALRLQRNNPPQKKGKVGRPPKASTQKKPTMTLHDFFGKK